MSVGVAALVEMSLPAVVEMTPSPQRVFLDPQQLVVEVVLELETAMAPRRPTWRVSLGVGEALWGGEQEHEEKGGEEEVGLR